MKDGLYLSVYTQINEIASAYNIHERHDHNMALWKKDGLDVTLLHYWEFERVTGLKKHSYPFKNADDALEFINQLLRPYNITTDDIESIWGTPEIEKTANNYTSIEEYSQFTYHSISHLFSCIMQDTDIFFNQKIIGLSLDAGPDNIIDVDAKKKNYYSGVYVDKGRIDFFHIPSPACLWAFMTYKFNLQEGTLMALGSASKSRLLWDFDDIKMGFIPVKNMGEGGETFKWFNTFTEKVFDLDEENIGIDFNFYDNNFTNHENKISMIVKVMQELSYEILHNTIEQILLKYKLNAKDLYLALAGGFTLNCPTNSRLMDSFGFKRLLAPPCVSDCGIALGIGLFSFYKEMKKINFSLQGAYYGDADYEIDNAVNNLTYKAFVKSVKGLDINQFVEDIKKEPLIWFDGRAEIGPRALGHRSLFADPRNEKSKEILNEIKQRQWWRPVAPMVLEDKLNEWFEGSEPSPYMLRTYTVKAQKQNLIPAVIHLDGSARVQTVDNNGDILYEIIYAFYKDTGVPILCNTSLNDRGEPIINTITEAFNFALRKGVRIAYINQQRVEFYNFENFKIADPESRKGKLFTPLEIENRKYINPYNMSIEELEFYLNHNSLWKYKLTDELMVSKLKKIIKHLKTIDWNTELNRIIN